MWQVLTYNNFVSVFYEIESTLHTYIRIAYVVIGTIQDYYRFIKGYVFFPLQKQSQYNKGLIRFRNTLSRANPEVSRIDLSTERFSRGQLYMQVPILLYYTMKLGVYGCRESINSACSYALSDGNIIILYISLVVLLEQVVRCLQTDGRIHFQLLMN